MKIRLVPLIRIRTQCELRNTKYFPVDVLDVLLPHR
jgi:hypothetical protein